MLIIRSVIAAVKYTGNMYPISDSFDLSFLPIRKYPATESDPVNARTSPNNRWTPCPRSLIAIIIDPVNARISPANIFLVIFSPKKKCDIIATNNGLVVTKTTDTATVVNSNDFIQVKKCIANRIPDIIAYVHCFLFKDFISFLRFFNAYGLIIKDANISLHAAIAIVLASD